MSEETEAELKQALIDFDFDQMERIIFDLNKSENYSEGSMKGNYNKAAILYNAFMNKKWKMLPLALAHSQEFREYAKKNFIFLRKQEDKVLIYRRKTEEEIRLQELFLEETIKKASAEEYPITLKVGGS
jgi:hypothetical protein